jgi:hypothetical protein
MAEMQNYNHVVGLKILCEMLPREANRVALAGDVDQYGLRISRITYSWSDNDKRLINHSLNFMTQALQAVDADTCHLNGTARMGSAPSNSVFNADCRSCDIPNLWICDGSVFPTGAPIRRSPFRQSLAGLPIAFEHSRGAANWIQAALQGENNTQHKLLCAGFLPECGRLHLRELPPEIGSLGQFGLAGQFWLRHPFSS